MEAATAIPRVQRRPGRFVRSLSDERLVSRVRSGDEAAFEAIYDRHHRGLLSFCRHMLGDQQEAEDAVQHTFIAAYRSLISGDREILLKAWLYAIARNRSLSVLRARREHVALDDVQPATEGLAAQVERRQDLKDLLGDLQRLPEEQRAALVLSEIGAHSHDEIGVILDVPKNKVKALVFQARTSIAETREARDTPCHVVQEQLATLHGGALRRNQIRRHVSSCAVCQAFKVETQRQRAAMAIVLPVFPALALKSGVLGATTASASSGGGGGGAAIAGAAATGGGGAGAVAVGMGAAGAGGGGAVFGGGVASGLAALAGKSLFTKAVVTAAVASTAGGGGYVVLKDGPSVTGRAASALVEGSAGVGTAGANGTQRGPTPTRTSVAGRIGLTEPEPPRRQRSSLERVARDNGLRSKRGVTTTPTGLVVDEPDEPRDQGAPSGDDASREPAGGSDQPTSGGGTGGVPDTDSEGSEGVDDDDAKKPKRDKQQRRAEREARKLQRRADKLERRAEKLERRAEKQERRAEKGGKSNQQPAPAPPAPHGDDDGDDKAKDKGHKKGDARP